MATPAVCKIDGCDKSGKLRRGLCGMHNQRLIRHGDPHARPAIRRHGCLVEGCQRAHVARGYCKLHYDRILVTGEAKADQPARITAGTRMEWLVAHLSHASDECLIWPFSRDRKGYARVTEDGVQRLASRTMCTMAHGPAPTDDLQAAHNCGSGHLGCVNPRHLRWDTVTGNHSDRAIHGTEIKGADQWQSKLTDDDVRFIRSARGVVHQRKLADRFGVRQTTISKIQRRAAWAWLE